MTSIRLMPAALVCFMCIVPPSPVSAEENPDKEKARPKIGLVLSGGGAKGLAHIGVLKVLEEEGIPIDYITGTSMGSVVGAMYSVGYTTKEIERISYEMDWLGILAETIPRRNIPLRERDGNDKYSLSFDFNRSSFRLPKGLIKGQALDSQLSKLLLPAHNIEDYYKLPVPFACVATDIENGNPVVLRSGYLPDSVRASMSIPSAFVPVEIPPHLFIDGGVSRNFPVSDVRDMGAQIVIGVDVGQPLYTKDELDSFVKIMEQSLSFLGDESTKKQRKLCDILILPDIKGISSSSFGDVKDIIERGERAAREKLPEIRALALSQKSYAEQNLRDIKPVDIKKPVRITSIRIHGLKEVSNTTVLALLGIGIPSKVSPDAIEDSIRDVYGCGWFDKVSFRVIPEYNDGNTLVVSVKEKDAHLL